MAARNETILSNQNHPDDNTVKSLSGEKFKGDGYYGRSDGIHTVQWNIANFIGAISIQGSLVLDPQASDWFKVQLRTNDEFIIDTTGKISRSVLNSVTYTESTSGSFSYNFVGNYVWVRAHILDWTSGTVNNIIMSH